MRHSTHGVQNVSLSEVLGLTAKCDEAVDTEPGIVASMMSNLAFCIDTVLTIHSRSSYSASLVFDVREMHLQPDEIGLGELQTPNLQSCRVTCCASKLQSNQPNLHLQV